MSFWNISINFWHVWLAGREGKEKGEGRNRELFWPPVFGSPRMRERRRKRSDVALIRSLGSTSPFRDFFRSKSTRRWEETRGSRNLDYIFNFHSLSLSSFSSSSPLPSSFYQAAGLEEPPLPVGRECKIVTPRSDGYWDVTVMYIRRSEIPSRIYAKYQYRQESEYKSIVVIYIPAIIIQVHSYHKAWYNISRI